MRGSIPRLCDRLGCPCVRLWGVRACPANVNQSACECCLTWQVYHPWASSLPRQGRKAWILAAFCHSLDLYRTASQSHVHVCKHHKPQAQANLLVWPSGGALVSVFAHCLAKLASDGQPIPGWPAGLKIVKKLMARVVNGGGIYTFAGKMQACLLVSDCLIAGHVLEQAYGSA